MLYKEKLKRNNISYGFTLIEMMVSVAIFSMIVVMGIGALLNMMQKYKISQQEKQAADSLNFVMETITREIRLGTHYYSNPGASSHSGVSRDGTSEYGILGSTSETYLIGFDASDSRGYITYFIRNGIIFRQRVIGGVDTIEPMTDKSQVVIDFARLRVISAGDPNDLKQALVWFQLSASSPDRPSSKKIIQTLVSQRILDN